MSSSQGQQPAKNEPRLRGGKWTDRGYIREDRTHLPRILNHFTSRLTMPQHYEEQVHLCRFDWPLNSNTRKECRHYEVEQATLVPVVNETEESATDAAQKAWEEGVADWLAARTWTYKDGQKMVTIPRHMMERIFPDLEWEEDKLLYTGPGWNTSEDEDRPGPPNAEEPLAKKQKLDSA